MDASDKGVGIPSGADILFIKRKKKKKMDCISSSLRAGLKTRGHGNAGARINV